MDLQTDPRRKHMERIKFNYGDNRWSLYKVKVEELVFQKSNFVINQYRQRKYLFNDVPMAKGHMWQREIFDSLLAGQPIPLIELNVIDELNKSIEDGQQRIKTIQAIVNNCITVSKNVVLYGVEYEKYIDCHFSALPVELQKKIQDTHLLVQSSEGLNEDELYQRFLKINDQNGLSSQDKRSGMNNVGAKYIQKLVDKPRYNMFEIVTINDNIRHKYNSVTTRGRELEEVMAHCFNFVCDADKFKVGQPNLDKLYKIDFENDNFPLDKKSKLFEKYLKPLDIALRSFNKPDMLGKKIVFLSYIVMKRLMDDGYKVDNDTFFKYLISVQTKLKKDDKLITFQNRITDKNPKGKTEKFNYSALFRLCSTKEAIKEIVDRLVDGILLRSGYTNVDSVRAFTKKMRYARWVEQDECCEYCGDSVDFEHTVADHREPHSEGGETVYENLAVACKKCNGMKSNMPYNLWEKALPHLKVFEFKTEQGVMV